MPTLLEELSNLLTIEYINEGRATLSIDHRGVYVTAFTQEDAAEIAYDLREKHYTVTEKEERPGKFDLEVSK